jgi:3-hydroxyisobutyryl-CoA hydrolase
MSTPGKDQSPAPIEEDDVIFQQHMGNRTILLNRPKKLNSLNLSMIQKILPRLKVFASTRGSSYVDVGEIGFGKDDYYERCWRESILCGW